MICLNKDCCYNLNIMESLSEQEKNTTIENTNEEKETTDITQLETELSSLFEKRDNLKKVVVVYSC